MATQPAKETAPAKQVELVTEPAVAAVPTADARKRVYVYDKESGTKLRNPVPVSWLDGRFPNLAEVPSSKQKEGN